MNYKNPTSRELQFARTLGRTVTTQRTQMQSPAKAQLRRTAHKRGAFTLIELLIVVATIALLISILLPSLKRARAQAKMAVSQANVRAIATSSLIFATENNDLSIPVHPLMGGVHGTVGEFEYGGKSGIGEPQSGNDPTSSKWGTAEGRGPATRGLNAIIYKGGLSDYQDNPGKENVNWLDDTRLDLAIFRAPSDTGYVGHHYSAWRDSGLTSYDHYGNSYAASTAWIGAPGPNCLLYSNSAYLKPMTRVPNPANTLFFLENCGLFGWRKSYGLDQCPFLSGGPLGPDVETVIKGWHAKPWHFATAFADGHAGMARIEGHNVPQPRLGAYPSHLNGSPGTYQGYHCVIIRGQGWQQDTLPAAPVLTTVECVQSGAIINPIE